MRRRGSLALALAVFVRAGVGWADPPSWLDRAVVAEVTRRAVERAGYGNGRTQSLARRSRAAGWLPNVSVRVGRNLGATLTQSTGNTNTDRLSADDSLVLDLRVQFSLDRLVFDPNEVSVARIEESRNEQRMALEASVVDLLARLETLRRARNDETPASAVVEALRVRARVEQLIGADLEAVFPGPAAGCGR